MLRQKEVLKILDGLEVLYSDLNHLIVGYTLPISGNFICEWQCKNGKKHNLRGITSSNKYIYINCSQHHEIYCYTFAGELVSLIQSSAYAIEIVNFQFYLLTDKTFFLKNLETNATIRNWHLPREARGYVGGNSLKVDEKEKIYWTPQHYAHYVYLYSVNGEEITKFGDKAFSQKVGKFDCPWGVTVNEKNLYVCDCYNHRIQVIDKENGTFICQWKGKERLLKYPRAILLYDNLLYVGDLNGIQVYTKDSECIQIFGSEGSGKEEFQGIRGLCMRDDKLYIVDCLNNRIQVWN